MKLGSETGSLINHVISRTNNPEPVLGMGATLLSWTDRAPATIIGVFKKTRMIKVQTDNYRRIDTNGFSESQSYEYGPNLHGSVYTFRQNKTGQWEEVFFNPVTKRYGKTGGHGLRIGVREKYHDFGC